MKCSSCGQPHDNSYFGNLCLKCYKRTVPKAFWPKALKEKKCAPE